MTTTSAPLDYQPDVACAAPDYDPEWWVAYHPGRCHTDCQHRLAIHICLNHCPLLRECRDMASWSSERWQGMVVGGMMGGPHGLRHLQGRQVTQCVECA